MNTLVILGIIGGAALIGLLLVIKYGYRYWADDELKKRVLPGDDLIKEEDKRMFFTKRMEINAPAEVVWGHTAQQGQEKAGFYSFDRLEQLFSFKIYNTYEIVPEWTKIKAGDWMLYHQCGFGSGIMEVEEGKYYTMLSDTRRPPVNKGKAFAIRLIPFGQFAWTWSFIVEPISDKKCVLIQRTTCFFSPNNWLTQAYVRALIALPSIVMTSIQMELIRDCSEGKPPKGSLLVSGHKKK